ncbi:MAG: ribosome maturation factor RimP [Pyrinomonadaceae bacterium]
MDKDIVSTRVSEIAARVAADSGLELVHVEIAGIKRDRILRIYIDKPDGVTIEDCSQFSRSVEDVLDSEDTIPSRYVLEVSSPGIERELYSLADFVKFEGKLAKVKTNIEIGGQKTFVGPIVKAADDQIVIDDRTQGNVTFKYTDVAKANLKIDLSKEFQGR